MTNTTVMQPAMISVEVALSRLSLARAKLFSMVRALRAQQGGYNHRLYLSLMPDTPYRKFFFSAGQSIL